MFDLKNVFEFQVRKKSLCFAANKLALKHVMKKQNHKEHSRLQKSSGRGYIIHLAASSQWWSGNKGFESPKVHNSEYNIYLFNRLPVCARFVAHKRKYDNRILATFEFYEQIVSKSEKKQISSERNDHYSLKTITSRIACKV